MEFCKSFNAKTKDQPGKLIPVVITVYSDRSFTFITKTPPASSLILEAAGLEKGSPEPNKEKVGTITIKQIQDIAKIKLPDLNTNEINSAIQMVKGTARSMGVIVQG